LLWACDLELLGNADYGRLDANVTEVKRVPTLLVQKLKADD
jgi:hypothetical protein